jgi:hypothetical protein
VGVKSDVRGRVSKASSSAATRAAAAHTRHARELARTSKSSSAALIMSPNAAIDCHVAKVRAI